MKYLLIILALLMAKVKAQTNDSLRAQASMFPRMHAEVTIGNSRNQAPLSYVVPAVCIGYGFLALGNNAIKRLDRSVYNDMHEDYPHFSSPIDNYMQYSPAAAAYVLKIAGIHGKSTLSDQTAVYFLSTAIMSTSVTFFKRTIHQLRPNGSSFSSFPSGHTATAFAAAELMNQEFGDRSIWYGIAAYSAATATGILRVYNNAHWFSNIIAGAGFGILSTKAAYAIYPPIRDMLQQHTNVSVAPFCYNRTAGLSISTSF